MPSAVAAASSSVCSSSVTRISMRRVLAVVAMTRVYGVIPYIPSRRFRLRDGGVASCFEQLGRLFLDLVEQGELQRLRFQHQRSGPLGRRLDPTHALVVATDVADSLAPAGEQPI